MVSKKYWEKPIIEFINLVRETREEKYVTINDTPFVVIPGVFSPAYSSDTAWFAEKIVPLTKNKTFLEIGSGTGVIACLAAINGASKVVATDINPIAIENIKQNAQLHSLNISIKEGSVFDPIPKKELFDIIFWNHPFYCSDKKELEDDMLFASVYDLKYRYLLRFFQKGKNYLTKNGRLILGTSNVARVNLIKKMALDEGYDLAAFEKVDVPIFKGKKIKMDLRIYSFTTRSNAR